MAELDRTGETIALLKSMKAFAKAGLEKDYKVDYFATSLAQMLVFDEEAGLQHRKRAMNYK